MQADKLQTDPSTLPASGAAREPLDVVIVSADMADMTLGCVEAIDYQPATPIVFDNAGAEASAAGDRLQELCTVVEAGEELGFAAANNRAVTAGNAPLILLLNSDIVATPGAIATLVATLLAEPRAVAAGGRLVDPDTGVTQAAYQPRRFPSLLSLAVIILGLEELWPGNPVTRAYHGGAYDSAGVQEVEQPAAAALLVRRDALARVGGFDERFWFWFEDSDLLCRLAREGTVLYVPGAVFRHIGGGTFAQWSKSERIRSVHHGMLHYADAHLSRPQRALFGALAIAVSAPRLALFRRSRPVESAAWRAVAAGGLALIAGRRPAAIAPGPS
ncbi:MAG TPA: glycosyltransferase [Solirubrobacteraceae bacterium]|jgi:GT2 family glycosyltransferase|nr:glycosyltransferase [Solirubrobacteraceae bacterium]